MNTPIFFRCSAAFLPALLLAGCLEEDVYTKVSDDGSCTRRITMHLDSRTVPDNAWPRATDSTWTVEWRSGDGGDDSVFRGSDSSGYGYTCIATKTFRTPRELCAEYASLPDTGHVRIDLSLGTSFAWFFTYYDYRETYRYRDTLRRVPPSAYLTADEIRRYVRGENSDSLRHKVDTWTMRNLFETLYGALIDDARRRADPALPATVLANGKMRCFDALLRTVRADENSATRDPTAGGLDDAHHLLKLFAVTLGTDRVLALDSAAKRAWMAAMDRESVHLPSKWHYAVELPGLLLETNGTELAHGAVPRWNFEPDRLEVGDYTMTASSRVTNVWAFVVTGFAGLALGIAAVRSGWRRRSGTPPAVDGLSVRDPSS